MLRWDELGISPTGEAAAIRRAYAIRLKQIRPDDDPAGFARLRAAYEAALTYVQRPGEAELAGTAPRSSREAAPMSQPAADLSPGTERLPSPTEADSAALIVSEALARRDITAAAEVLEAARTSSTLPLEWEMALTDRLLAILVTDRSLPGSLVLDVATRFGWRGEPESDVGDVPLLRGLQARIAAERWLESLQTEARSLRLYFGSQPAVAARLLLGRGRFTLSWILPPEPPLGHILAEYHLHQRWIAASFDSTRIAAVERMAKRRYTRHSGTIWIAVLGVAIFSIMARQFSVGIWWIFFITLQFHRRLRAYVRPLTLATLVVMLAVIGARQVIPIEPLVRKANVEAPTAELLHRANRGDTNAAFEVGILYATGKGVAKNDYEASLWFRRSLHDHPQAATWLGLLYETGRGEPKDPMVARQYYAEAAAQGDMYGQVNLARMLVDGRGGPADPVEAFRWNMAAARQGSPDGLNGVGYSYLIGHGVAQDHARGVSWLRAAAEAGQPNAMHTLGSLYLQGS